MINLKSQLTNTRYFKILMHSIELGVAEKEIPQEAIDDNDITDAWVELQDWQPYGIVISKTALQEIKDKEWEKLII